MDLEAQLVSRSCTTGWADWIHGELWLSQTLLVRRRLTLAETRANGNRQTVAEPLSKVPAESLNLDGILAAHPTNKVLALDDVLKARIHSGILNDRLALEMRDGSRHKLLWLKADSAFDVLGRALGKHLGHRLERD